MRVNAVAPGPIDTPMISFGLQMPTVRDAIDGRTPPEGRTGTLGEVADVVAFLASDAACCLPERRRRADDFTDLWTATGQRMLS
nr:SDR family oxidoreductase [Streptomyces lunaelactis]